MIWKCQIAGWIRPFVTLPGYSLGKRIFFFAPGARFGRRGHSEGRVRQHDLIILHLAHFNSKDIDALQECLALISEPRETLVEVKLTKASQGKAKAPWDMAQQPNDGDCHTVPEKQRRRAIGAAQEEITAIETEQTKRRCLELADIIAASELPWSKAIQEAEQELSILIKRGDAQTREEVAKRIRGFSYKGGR